LSHTQPSLSPAPKIDDINTSQREIYDTLTGARTGEQLRGQGNYVHVSVAAEAHVRATHAAEAGGERIIVRSGYFFYQDFRKYLFIPELLFQLNAPCCKVDAAAELGIPNVARGEPYSTAKAQKNTTIVSTKCKDLLGLNEAIPLKDVIEESVKDFKARGYPGFTA
jgi:nucleoside-diphosphate-sugar epimerase